MSERNFHNAAWVAIIAAALFPIGLIIEGMYGAAMATGVLEMATMVSPGDFIFLAFAIFSIYAYKKLKRYLFEYYSFRGADTIIEIIIWMFVIFYGGSLLLELFFAPLFSANDIGPSLVVLTYNVVCIIIFGVVDIIFSVILLKNMEQFSTQIKVFAILSLIMGICEVTVILVPLNLLLIPMVLVSMAFIFFKKEEELEFV